MFELLGLTIKLTLPLYSEAIPGRSQVYYANPAHAACNFFAMV